MRAQGWSIPARVQGAMTGIVPERRLAYLDGLRAIAALMVFLIHSGAPALRAAGPIGNSIVDHGKYGVTVFFVVSAYSLCVSLRPAFDGGRVSWAAYFVRRFFRIAPLYYVVLAYVLLSGSVSIAHEHSSESVLLHVTFGNVFAPQFANDILSVEWSIAVEWVFYANRSYSLLFHFYAFVLGMVVFRAVSTDLASPIVRRLMTAASVALVAIMLLRGETDWSGPMVAIVACSAMLNAAAGTTANRFLSWKPLVWVGIVSYSIYLLHFLIIGAFAGFGLKSDLAMIGALIVTIAGASLTYAVIEKPFRQVGRQIVWQVAGPT